MLLRPTFAPTQQTPTAVAMILNMSTRAPPDLQALRDRLLVPRAPLVSLCRACRRMLAAANGDGTLCTDCARRIERASLPAGGVQCPQCRRDVPAERLSLGECAHCGPLDALLLLDDASVREFLG
jgi:hypothetical protein